MRRSRPLLVFLLTLASAAAQALGPTYITARSGMVMGTLGTGTASAADTSSSGADATTSAPGSINTIPYLDLEYGLLTSSRVALAFRGILAVDMAVGDINYAFFGGGQRYFMGANALPLNRSEGGHTVSISPKLNYYVGWDLGIAHTVINRVGVLSFLASTGADLGATAGLRYYLFGPVALDVGAGASFFYGFTQVAASGLVMKFFLGASF